MAKKKSIRDLLTEDMIARPAFIKKVVRKKQKPGPKKGSGSKVNQFNMRCSADFRPKLAWLRANERTVYHSMTDSQILELMVENAVLICEITGQAYKPITG